MNANQFAETQLNKIEELIRGGDVTGEITDREIILEVTSVLLEKIRSTETSEHWRSVLGQTIDQLTEYGLNVGQTSED